MKKFILTLIILVFTSISNTFAGRCLEGAVFDVDENRQAQLMDCAKWERNSGAVLAWQDAINAYTSEEVDFSNADNPTASIAFGRIIIYKIFFCIADADFVKFKKMNPFTVFSLMIYE